MQRYSIEHKKACDHQENWYIDNGYDCKFKVCVQCNEVLEHYDKNIKPDKYTVGAGPYEQLKKFRSWERFKDKK